MKARFFIKAKYLSYACCLIIFLLSCSSSDKSNPTGPPTTSEHFQVVLYDGLDSSVAADVHDALTKNYRRICNDLQVGDQPHPQVTVKIWGNYDNFLTMMTQVFGKPYHGATGFVLEKEMRLFHTGHTRMAAVHEYAHLVSLYINDSIDNNPRWLWEAVALYESREFIDPKKLPFMVKGNYPTLAQLSTNYNDSDKSIYRVGYVLGEYIVKTWGQDALVELIKNNGKLTTTLGVTTQEFESGWHTYVEETYLN